MPFRQCPASKAIWPANPRYLPVSATPVLGLRVLTTILDFSVRLKLRSLLLNDKRLSYVPHPHTNALPEKFPESSLGFGHGGGDWLSLGVKCLLFSPER